MYFPSSTQLFMNEISSTKALASFFYLVWLAGNESLGEEMLCGDSLDLSHISCDILPQLQSYLHLLAALIKLTLEGRWPFVALFRQLLVYILMKVAILTTK